jgi:hypothetical protein
MRATTAALALLGATLVAPASSLAQPAQPGAAPAPAARTRKPNTLVHRRSGLL